jgi:hypothetical protein
MILRINRRPQEILWFVRSRVADDISQPRSARAASNKATSMTKLPPASTAKWREIPSASPPSKRGSPGSALAACASALPRWQNPGAPGTVWHARQASPRGPAYLLDRSWTARAWNARAERLFTGWLDDPERNLLRFIFLAPAARSLICGWEERARRVERICRRSRAARPGQRSLPTERGVRRVLAPAWRVGARRRRPQFQSSDRWFRQIWTGDLRACRPTGAEADGTGEAGLTPSLLALR